MSRRRKPRASAKIVNCNLCSRLLVASDVEGEKTTTTTSKKSWAGSSGKVRRDIRKEQNNFSWTAFSLSYESRFMCCTKLRFVKLVSLLQASNFPNTIQGVSKRGMSKRESSTIDRLTRWLIFRCVIIEKIFGISLLSRMLRIEVHRTKPADGSSCLKSYFPLSIHFLIKAYQLKQTIPRTMHATWSFACITESFSSTKSAKLYAIRLG